MNARRGPVGLVPTRIPHRGPVPTEAAGRPERPTLTTWTGGRRVKVDVGDRLQAPLSRRGGGPRGTVKRFTAAARRRLRLTLASVRRDAPVLFVTLTYPASTAPDAERVKVDLDTFAKRLRRRWAGASFVWVLEHHKSGVPHLHLLCFGVEYRALRAWLPMAWFEVCQTDVPAHLQAGTRVERPRCGVGLSAYLAKYASKGRAAPGVDASAWGRWWGVVGRASVPWARPEVFEVSRPTAVRLVRWVRAAGTPVTAWAARRAGWTREPLASRARWRVRGRRMGVITRVADPDAWARAMVHAEALVGGWDPAPWSSFGAWDRATTAARG